MSFNADKVKARALYAPDAMAAIDAHTVESGVALSVLIDRAAAFAFRVIRARYPRQPVVVLAGPGHNGDDGLALAALLADAGWPLTVIDLSPDRNGPLRDRVGALVRPSGTFAPKPGMLIIDALFGAGLTRPVDGEARDLLLRLEESGATTVAIDLPSGLDGATGDVRGAAVRADTSVTFRRLKPGHLIGRGPDLCGDVFVGDIGLVDQEQSPTALWNDPGLWQHWLGPKERETHKYRRGHVAVIGGPQLQGGAGRLAARAASVSGAGAVTYFTPLSGADYAANHFDAVMVQPLIDPKELAKFLSEKADAVVLGPGMGHSSSAHDVLRVVLEGELPTVVDADALTMHEDVPHTLFKMLHRSCLLTPHEGEFSRLFPDLAGDRMVRAVAASKRSGAHVLLKGASTVMAGGEYPIINTNAEPVLATAGAGDVLAGLTGGLLAQGLPVETAAAAGAWIHAEASRGVGPGLNADQLPGRIAKVISKLSIE